MAGVTRPLPDLNDAALGRVASALRTGRLAPPYGELAIGRFAPAEVSEELAAHLNWLSSLEMSPLQIATGFELIIRDRRRRGPSVDSIDLVTTGPDDSSIPTRDTAVIVRSLFASAHTSVLVVGFAVHQGARVFRALAERMVEVPTLEVRLVLDIQRPFNDTSSSSELVSRFAKRFREKEWPEHHPLPEVHYYPASLEIDAQAKSTMHAKCIIVDDVKVYIGSANFTDAAQRRNVEVGVLVDSQPVARRLGRHFDAMRDAGHLEELSF